MKEVYQVHRLLAFTDYAGGVVTHFILSSDDDELLDRFQRAAFAYFTDEFNPENGLVADRSREGAPASIAVVGFALSAYPIAVRRNWISRTEAASRSLVTLRFFWNSLHNDQPDATGYKGFYYHFLDLQTGRRVWRSELSVIDSTFLVAGALTASLFFVEDNEDEREIRSLAEQLYRRMDWQWAQNGRPAVAQGWKPECGFLNYGWEGYDEALILYVLGLGSPTYPLSEESFVAWTSTYEWENIYGYDVLYSGPLFTHEYSHAWIDFRAIQDAFMRSKGSDYFRNSQQAIRIQREYAMRNPHEFEGYGRDCWGFTACDGPGNEWIRVRNRDRRFFGYSARGVPFGPDDGTISPSACLESLPFAPDMALDAMRHICEKYPSVIDRDRFAGSFNPTFSEQGSHGWLSEGHFGLDQGMIVLMIENHRSQWLWELMRTCSYIRNGLQRAGFTGGWL